jgi:outer membrane protein assembly factor BamD (BamD/ComL family)
MKPFFFFLFFSLTLAPPANACSQGDSYGYANTFADSQSAATKDSVHEDDMYKSAYDAMYQGNYDHAIRTFDQVAALHGRKADSALYWKAYALKQTGNKTDALATLAQLEKEYPQSRWKNDAGVMKVELQGAAANPGSASTEEEKLMALQGIMQSDSERAIPYIEKLLHGTGSPKLKDRALFVLMQSGSDRAADALLSVAKDNKDPELQVRAIRYLGMSGHKRNLSALKEIYNGATDASVKKAVFQGWLMAGDKEDVLAVARSEKSVELRKDAIRHLGMMGARNELREMYKSSPDAETHEAIIQGMMMNGDSQGLIEIARTEKDANLRDKAIKTIGMVGGQDSMSALADIYNTQSDVESKKSVINALFMRGAAKEMVAMARKETNPDLKKSITQKLSMMHSPEVTDYMMEILNK